MELGDRLIDVNRRNRQLMRVSERQRLVEQCVQACGIG